MNTCTNCGQELGAVEVGTYPYMALPGLTLHGVGRRTCPGCGDVEVSIPRVEELHRLLAHFIAHRRGRLSGPEVRFLRKHLGWSGTDFAKLFSTSPSMVSRWENGRSQMDVRAEQLLRVCATRLEPVDDYAAFEDLLKLVAQHGAGERPPLDARWQGDRWAMAA